MSHFSDPRANRGLPSTQFQNVTGYVHEDFRRMRNEIAEELQSQTENSVDGGTVMEAIIATAHRTGVISLDELEKMGPSRPENTVDASDAPEDHGGDDPEPDRVEDAPPRASDEPDGDEESGDQSDSFFDKQLF